MDYTFGHHSHTHHHGRRDDDDEDRDERRVGNYPPPGTTVPPAFDDPPPPRPPSSYYGEDEPRPPRPPPSYYGEDEPPPPPPPPHLSHAYHTSHVPPPSQESNAYTAFSSESGPRPPAYTTTTHLEHVAHDVETHHTHRPHFPSFPHHQTLEPTSSDLSNRRTSRVFSKADPNYSLAIRDGHIILASSDPSDDFQHWYKDEKYSTRVKDEEGYPCFALVNKATGQAIKHSIGATHPVQLIPYNADFLDESVLWTQSKDFGDGFRAVRMVNNIRLNMDAFHGDKKSGGVHDGTTIVLWQWNKGDNQLWKIIPY